jgi:hypothetical protein
MAKVQTPSNSPMAVAPVLKSKTVRKVSTKAFGKIENAFNETMLKCLAGELEIERLVKEIQSKARVVSVDQKTGKETTVKLNQFELSLRKKQLAEKNTEVKVLNIKLNNTGSSLKNASSRSAEAARLKSKRINSNIRLSRKAIQNIDKIKEVVSTFIKSLQKTNDVNVSALRALATTNGRKFYSDAQKLLRNAQFQAEIKEMIAASAPVRTELSNMIRTSFGWTRKTK